MRNRVGLVCFGSMLAALPVLAQQPSGGVAQVTYSKPKSGMVAQYEQGRKKHVEFHRKQNDTWTWGVSEIVSGPRTGQYVAASVGHAWKDFDGRDAFNAADDADYNTNVAPFEESAVTTYWELAPAISILPTSPEPSALAQLFYFRLRPEAVEEFNLMAKKIHEGIQKTKWGGGAPYVWINLASGGDHPTMALVVFLPNWAAMAGPETPFPAMLEKAFGRTEAAAILAGLSRATLGERSELLRFRRDLSYTPSR